MEITISNQVATMSSVDLVSYINDLRPEGRPELRHDNFMAKVENHPGIEPPKFLGRYKDDKGEYRKCYYLPERDILETLMARGETGDRIKKLSRQACTAAGVRLNQIIERINNGSKA